MDAERSLRLKETKKAREDVRIAGKKIQDYLDRLSDARRVERRRDDGRIFPMTYAPVVVEIDGRRQVRPMRYTCRLAGKPANYDVRYPGTYNARRDNLGGFWKDVYGRHHAILVVTECFENVATHRYERRELRDGEAETNAILNFRPQQEIDMVVACLWDHWPKDGEQDLWSFSVIADEPPPEVAATGHERCIIAIRPERVAEWLHPADLRAEQVDAVLSDRESVFYEHRIAA